MIKDFTDYKQNELLELITQYKEQGITKAPMKGFHNDLSKILSLFEGLCNSTTVHYLGYSLSDAPFHGWNGETLKSMNNIDDILTEKMLEIYALLLIGVGQEDIVNPKIETEDDMIKIDLIDSGCTFIEPTKE